MRPERSRKAETLMVLLAHPCPKMSLILSKIKQKQPVHYAQTQFSVLHHQQSAPSSSSGNKISPAILFTIIILAVVFFISGLLHLLVRFLVKRSRPASTSEADRNAEFAGSDDAFQRQLQQLFNLHDSGLDQAFIDALPVFLYREIAMGVKEPFDCAVCLSEFSEQDKLRLLPLCSHAFHIDCIDRWLLSNSSCPLCRGSLNAHGMAFENPAFDLEDPREEEEKEEDRFSWIGEHGASISQKPEENSILSSKRVFSVRLGKLRRFNDGRVEIGDGESSSINTGTSTSNPSLDSRRCFSMGSYQYVVSDLELQVTLCPDGSRNHQKGSIGNANEGNLNFHGDCEGKRISIGSKAESFSVSKIWLWSKKTRAPDCPEAHIGSVPLPLSLPWMDKSQVT